MPTHQHLAGSPATLLALQLNRQQPSAAPSDSSSERSDSPNTPNLQRHRSTHSSSSAGRKSSTEAEDDKDHAPSRLQRTSNSNSRTFDARPSVMPISNYDSAMPQALAFYHQATLADPSNYKAWHAWAVMNFRVVSHYEKENKSKDVMYSHIVPAINGFFRSVALQSGGTSSSLQDILRLLTLWFRHGVRTEVSSAVVDGFNAVSVDTWLAVIPQIIARIDAPHINVRRLVHEALRRIGRAHPQALVYPLTICCKSPHSPARKLAGNAILDDLRLHSPVLVEQALLVSTELIRVAILWHEQWNEAIEEAFRCIFFSHNVEAAFSVLMPLHEMMRRGPETQKEAQFMQTYGNQLQDAEVWCRKYSTSRQQQDLSRANEIYNAVLKKIVKEVSAMTELDLAHISPKLLASRDMELAVPGTYRVNHPIIRIAHFDQLLKVIESKQVDRRLVYLLVLCFSGLHHS